MDNHDIGIVRRVRWPKILLLGDSQTQEAYGPNGCWVSILSDHYQRRADVINRGFTGYNSRWLKWILPQIVDKEYLVDCAAVTLFLGSNDASSEEVEPQLHIPLLEYEQNLKDICLYLQSLGLEKEKIILITPPPVDEEFWDHYVKSSNPEGRSALSNSVMRQYAEACCSLSSEINVKCLDLFTAMFNHKDWRELVSVDGLHISTKGGQLLAKLLLEILESSSTADIKQLYPDYSDITNSNLTEYFGNTIDLSKVTWHKM